MRAFRVIIVFATLQAVVAAPVLAVAGPCCCRKRAETKPVETKPPCCQAAAERAHAAVALHSCCAKELAQRPSPQALTGCCCWQAPPVSNVARENVSNVGGDETAVSFAFVPADFQLRPTVGRSLTEFSGQHSVSGPPLLALYCTWLK